MDVGERSSLSDVRLRQCLSEKRTQFGPREKDAIWPFLSASIPRSLRRARRLARSSRLLVVTSALGQLRRDTCGRHDTIYGCCSEANNLLRYGVRDTPSCYANFREILARFELDERSIVSNVNFFMSVPVLPDGSAGVAGRVSQPGNYVELRAERDVLAILSNCPQTHNPCNGYNPTPIRVVIYKPLEAPESV